MKQLDVVGAVIINRHGEVLCALRSQRMPLPGMWEFPGGKIEEGENPQQALKREIKEELDIDIKVGELVSDSVYEYPDTAIHLMTYYASIVSGEPNVREHEKVVWLARKDLSSLEWAPADMPTVTILSE
ncbi:(deoxy)nucleoside triphosphate pyrophosphohydrolase [Aneurinibacillus terranovensis]|uniref:(deoxy)nucleoside triphosphate pyrophosphohydrolase n=1 Tax=Aneurinibacillus terranovensis TaxID=278991 RepID=UPI0004292C16|nr:(deoxy)nucleoside triphosphate pyrophosphohydrolase [Aneurinibacillus terranovensis]